MEHAAIVAKKEAYRYALLKTTDPNTSLPSALDDTYKDFEDYNIKSEHSIYNALMTLPGRIALTDTQKEILKNAINTVIKDGKMLDYVENPRDPNVVTYRNIEEETKIQLDPTAIRILTEFIRTFQYNKVNSSHNYIIATNREMPVQYYIETNGNKPSPISENRTANLIGDNDDAFYYQRGIDKLMLLNPIMFLNMSAKEIREALKKEVAGVVYDRFDESGNIVTIASDEELSHFRTAIKQNNNNSIDIPDISITTAAQLKAVLENCDSEIPNLIACSKILAHLSSNNLTPEQQAFYKSYIDKFKDSNHPFINESLMATLTPEGLIKEPGTVTSQTIYKCLAEAQQKIPGLKECLDEIHHNLLNGKFNNVRPKPLFSKDRKGNPSTVLGDLENILAKAVANNQITLEDAKKVIASANCMNQLTNNINLSTEEVLRFVILDIGESFPLPLDTNQLPKDKGVIR